MRIEQVKSFEDLELFLRTFTNFRGDPAPYDFNGAFQLFEALLENLSQHHLDSDLESLEEHQPILTENQRRFLRKLDRAT